MSITISRLHEPNSWEMAVASGPVTSGTAEDILRALADRMGCKLSITEQRVKSWDGAYTQEMTEQFSEEQQRIIDERNADGRHPIG